MMHGKNEDLTSLDLTSVHSVTSKVCERSAKPQLKNAIVGSLYRFTYQDDSRCIFLHERSLEYIPPTRRV